MRTFSLILCLAMFQLSGCTSLRSVEMTPSQLQQKIRAGDVIKQGDAVKLVTLDGRRHEFTVSELTATTISSESESIVIDDIIALETREFSGGKTALLVGSMITIYTVLAALAASIMIGF